jgi:hypothetical protein
MHAFMVKLKTLEKVGQYTQKSNFSAHKYSLFCFLHIMVIRNRNFWALNPISITDISQKLKKVLVNFLLSTENLFISQKTTNHGTLPSKILRYLLK